MPVELVVPPDNSRSHSIKPFVHPNRVRNGMLRRRQFAGSIKSNSTLCKRYKTHRTHVHFGASNLHTLYAKTLSFLCEIPPKTFNYEIASPKNTLMLRLFMYRKTLKPFHKNEGNAIRQQEYRPDG